MHTSRLNTAACATATTNAQFKTSPRSKFRAEGPHSCLLRPHPEAPRCGVVPSIFIAHAASPPLLQHQRICVIARPFSSEQNFSPKHSPPPTTLRRQRSSFPATTPYATNFPVRTPPVHSVFRSARSEGGGELGKDWGTQKGRQRRRGKGKIHRLDTHAIRLMPKDA